MNGKFLLMSEHITQRPDQLNRHVEIMHQSYHIMWRHVKQSRERERERRKSEAVGIINYPWYTQQTVATLNLGVV
jgi:predicted metal-dependent peptidase